MTGQLQWPAALFPGKSPPVPIQWTVGWAPGVVWIVCRKETSLSPAGSWNTIHLFYSWTLQVAHDHSFSHSSFVTVYINSVTRCCIMKVVVKIRQKWGKKQVNLFSSRPMSHEVDGSCHFKHELHRTNSPISHFIQTFKFLQQSTQPWLTWRSLQLWPRTCWRWKIVGSGFRLLKEYCRTRATISSVVWVLSEHRYLEGSLNWFPPVRKILVEQVSQLQCLMLFLP